MHRKADQISAVLQHERHDCCLSRIRRNAAELVTLAPDVILAGGGAVVGPLEQATRTVLVAPDKHHVHVWLAVEQGGPLTVSWPFGSEGEIDRIQAMAIKEVVAAARSPWQNPYVERVIGSIRRECLNHLIIFDERHLRRVLSSYFHYYHKARTHLSLDKDCDPPDTPTRCRPDHRVPGGRRDCITATNAVRREISEAARSACPHPIALNSFLSRDR